MAARGTPREAPDELERARPRPAGARVGRRLLPLALLALTATTVASPRAAAQITGVVMDQDGVPLPGVAVEVWTQNRKLGGILSDAAGRFSFPEWVADVGYALYAGALGHRPAVVNLRPGVTEYEIRLERDPIPLPALVVEATRERCSYEDEDRARDLWERVRGNYSRSLDTLGIATYLASDVQIVPPERVGTVGEPAEADGQRGSSSLLRFSWSRRIKREGYAHRIRRTTAEQSYDSWVYPPLEADFAPHFVDPLFGELHRFRIEAEDSDGTTTVLFCPKDDDRPSMEGTLRVSPDAALVLAEWLFKTPEPAEGAGGRAVFGPTTGDPATSYPLPIEGLFWRKSPPDAYWQRYQKFEEWIVAAGDSVPFLPKRGRGSKDAREPGS